MMYWGNGTTHMGWGVAMMIAMLVFWTLIAYFVVRSLRGGTLTSAPTSQGATQILGERLARGEIEIEDYQARLAQIQLVRPGR